MSDRSPPLPAHAAHAYPARAIRAQSGANQGDAIAGADGVELGDIYRLNSDAVPLRLMLHSARPADRHQMLASGSDLGQHGEEIDLLALLTLMAADGARLEILLVHHGASGTDYALPLSPMLPRTDYTLLAATADIGDIRIADVVCVSFAAGTLITLPGGSLTPIEKLCVEDRVLTRDHGPQPVRWIGKATMRAAGAFAPVVITAGTLGNLGDLVVSPHHRIFIYQRGKNRVAGTAELLVQAKHLVDDQTVYRREGGFVDYYSLVFDRHEIIYAEGIPAESLMVNEATLQLIPEAIAEEVRARFPGLIHSPHFGTEITRRQLDQAGRDALLRKPRRD